MLSGGFESVHLTFIQRFEFPQPVFLPEKFEEGDTDTKEKTFEFFLDPILMNEEIYFMRERNLDDIGIIKPIKNIKSQKDSFWKEFAYKKRGEKLTEGSRLPYYPFQIFPDKWNLKEDRSHIEEVTGMKIIDSKVNAQMRLFPCGIGTVHLYLYLKPRELNADQLLRITSKPPNIRVSYTDFQKRWKKTVLEFFNHFVNRTMGQIFKRPSNKVINGYFLLFNFQGRGFETLSEDVVEDFEKVLENRSYIRKKEKYSSEVEFRRIIEEKNLDRSYNGVDYVFISPKTAILFIDEGIRDIEHFRVLKGRRCLRGHFMNILEMAYNLEWLIRYYDSHFEWILEELEAERIKKSLRDRLRKTKKPNILEDQVYKTLGSSVLSIPKKLEQIDEFYSKIFKHSIAVMNLGPQLTKMKSNLDQVYQQAAKRNVQVGLLDGVYKELKWWAKAVIPKFPDLTGTSGEKGKEEKSV